MITPKTFEEWLEKPVVCLTKGIKIKNTLTTEEIGAAGQGWQAGHAAGTESAREEMQAEIDKLKQDIIELIELGTDQVVTERIQSLERMIEGAVKVYEAGAITYMSEGEEQVQRDLFGQMQDYLYLAECDRTKQQE